MLQARSTRFSTLAVCSRLAAMLCVIGAARVEADPGSIIRNPGGIQGPANLLVLPFRRAQFLHASTFNGTVPRRSTDPERLSIEAIDWARGTFTGSVYLFLDPYGQAARATTGQIRAAGGGFEVSFVATKGSEQTSFVGRLAEVITADRQFWVLEGNYTYRPPIFRCSVGVSCTLGPLPVQMQGVVAR